MPTAKVLLADDSQVSLAVVRHVLESSGYDVVATRDGLEAMEAVYREAPDVVLLDVMMPRMTGYQVCRMLKLDDQTNHIPVVMLTSMDQPADQYWGLQTGADIYLSKGQPPAAVLEAVVKALASRSQPSEGRSRGDSIRSPNPLDLLSRLNDVLDRKLYEATVLGEMSKLAWATTDLDRAAREVMALFGKLIDFHLACMAIRGHGSGATELVWMARRPVSAGTLTTFEESILAALGEGARESADRRAVRSTVVTGSGVTIGAREEKDPPPLACHELPLGTREHSAGIFAIWCGSRSVASVELLKTVDGLANAAFAVLDNVRLYREMQRLAATDGLTSLANYRQFQETLEREFHRSRRSTEPLALMMLDLDNFKSINDCFGHKQGDLVLQAVAETFARNARPYDLVARYGGEEFAVVLPSTTAQAALGVGERYRLLVRDVAERLRMERLGVSVGVATYPDSRIADAQSLVREADAALYLAKSRGKNQVCMARQKREGT